MEVERATSALQLLDINRNNPVPESSTWVSPEKTTPTHSGRPSSSHSQAHKDDVPDDSLVLHKLSRINGVINKMCKEELQEQLQTLGLNTCGVKEILNKRLKTYYKRQKTPQSRRLQQEEEKATFDYLVVIDYEATCEQNNHNFVHEIIEFPAVLVDVRTCTVTNVFQKFCKPKVNPRLTEFCTNLTGITQAQVDEAQDFRDVFQEFVEWMKSHSLGRNKKFAIVTDGPWDMARFLKTQTELSQIKYPSWAKQWINLRKMYASFYNVRRMSLRDMLDELDMEFEGRPHCGLDDSRNIAAIARCLLKDGCIFKNNEYLHEHRHLSQPSPQSKPQSSPTARPPTQGLHATHRGRKAPSREEVPQEGENVEDLLWFAKLQSSR